MRLRQQRQKSRERRTVAEVQIPTTDKRATTRKRAAPMPPIASGVIPLSPIVEATRHENQASAPLDGSRL